MLIEINGCIFDEEQYKGSHGYESLDSIGKEAFVNHIHLDDENRVFESKRIIKQWIQEMKTKWQGKEFKIYRQIEPDEITIRFHMVRKEEPDWCDSGLEIIRVIT